MKDEAYWQAHEPIIEVYDAPLEKARVYKFTISNELLANLPVLPSTNDPISIQLVTLILMLRARYKMSNL